MTHEAWMSKPLKNGLVECHACNHQCKIPEGKTGICGVRQNKKGKLYLLVYGKASAYNVDPVEKKPLFHFYPGAQVFSFGTVGCNFRCLFCQNWDLSQYHKFHDDIEKLPVNFLPEDVIKYCKKENIPLIAFTYNEPAIFFEYAYDTAKLAHENNMKTIYVSNGFETREALEKIKPYLDAINVDLKAFTDEFYKRVCGGRIAPVKENIKWIWESGIWTEVTTLVIPNQNDSDEELRQIAEFLVNISPDLPWHISAYYPAYKMKEPPTPPATLMRAYEIGKKAGLNYVYVGNIYNPEKESTYCPKCNTSVIERYGYSTENHLKKDKCPKCGQKISGKF